MISLNNNSLAEPINEIEIQSLDKFRFRIQNETTLKCPLDDIYLLKFLRQRNGDLDRALESILYLWNQSIIHKDIWHGIFPSNYEDFYRTNYIQPLNSVDANGRPVVVFRAEKWDPSKYSFVEMVRSIFPLLDTLIIRQATQLHGLVVIIDLKGIGVTHLRGFSLKVLRFCLAMLYVLPVKLKGVHFVNNLSIINGLWKCAKTFLKPKLRKRICFHGSNFESLHEYVKPEILPQTYGGKLEIADAYEEIFMGEVLARDNYFRDLFEHSENNKSAIQLVELKQENLCQNG